MQLPYTEALNIQYFSQLFRNTSECYKFFWFQAILTKVEEGRTVFSFDELVDEMITEAWYMVSEYHLNLGPRDNLELIVQHIHETTKLKPSEKKSEILKYLKSSSDKEVMRLKRVLIANVPYRLQSPLMPELKSKDLEGASEAKISRINQQRRLMYYFGMFRGLNTEIFMQPEWISYIRKNQVIIRGWLQYHMIKYLQKRNPSVPGISDKLMPPAERNLEKVKKYWRTIVELHPIYDIYGDTRLTSKEISIDHFIPWSYVAHDELWNLHPTTRSINSSKSNNLPDWNTYFPLLCRQEYISYQLIWKYDKIHQEFNKCKKEHLNTNEILYRLYRKGIGADEFEKQLEEIMQPVYQSAKNSGFRRWVYGNEEEKEVFS